MVFNPYDPEFARRDWETDVEGTVRFAIIGLGWFGRDEAIPAVEDSDYCNVSTVVSGSSEKAERVGDEYDATPLSYEEFQDGEAVDDYDAIYVVTPNALHLPYVETAAKYGKDVLCEKPLEASSERAEALVDTADEGGIELMTAYRMQGHPPTRRIRDAVRDGFIGDVVQIDGAFSFYGLNRDPDRWRFNPELAGGGPLYDVGIYPMNTSRFVLDDDPVAVQASVTRDEEMLGGMDLHVSFQLEFPDDVVATCRTSYGNAGENMFRVIGTRGTIEMTSAFSVRTERTIKISHPDASTEVRIENDELRETFDYFANHVLSDHDIRPDGHHGLVDMRTMDAIYESDESDRRIYL